MVALQLLKMGSIGDDKIIIPSLSLLVCPLFDDMELLFIDEVCDKKLDGRRDNNNQYNHIIEPKKNGNIGQRRDSLPDQRGKGRKLGHQCSAVCSLCQLDLVICITIFIMPQTQFAGFFHNALFDMQIEFKGKLCGVIAHQAPDNSRNQINGDIDDHQIKNENHVLDALLDGVDNLLHNQKGESGG